MHTQESKYSIAKARVVHQVGRVPFLGRTLRWFAQRYPEGSIVTIKTGCLAGSRWIRRHRHVNAYWVGNYELAIQKCLTRELKPGDVFYDVGANAGFFSLLGSKRVGQKGHVFAFEPLPENIKTLKGNLQLNDIQNCTVVEAAVSDSVGTVRFSPGPHSSMAHIAQQGSDGQELMLLRAVTLDEFASTSPVPDFIKMDIEGAEIRALHGSEGILEGACPPKLMIEFHGEGLREQGRILLGKHGYSFFTLDGKRIDSGSLPHYVLAVPASKMPTEPEA